MLSVLKVLLVNISMTMGLHSDNLQQEFIKFDPYNLNAAYKVKKIATPIEQDELIDVLCSSHVVEFGKAPQANRLALSWAQVALENNRGKKVWNNNLGNQGPFRMDQEYYYHLRGGWPYRSFKSHEESGTAYWRLIKKCSMALKAFDVGDPETAAKSLKKCNYYSTDQEQYSRVLKSLYYEVKAKYKSNLNCGSQSQKNN